MTGAKINGIKVKGLLTMTKDGVEVPVAAGTYTAADGVNSTSQTSGFSAVIIRDSDLKTYEIAERVGYNNVRRFVRQGILCQNTPCYSISGSHFAAGYSLHSSR